MPQEFTAEAVAAAVEASDAFLPFKQHLECREPYHSMISNNPWLKAPGEDEELVFGTGNYYDTTVARKHDYWQHQALPEPTRDMNQLRHDFYEWGFCLIADGIGEESRLVMLNRLAEQAEAERIAKLAHFTPFFQIVWYLINKGDCFVRCIEHDPEWIQGARVQEQLLDEFLGRGWYSYSMAGNIAYPGCKPMSSHQDQGAIHPLQTPDFPVLVNTMYMLVDVNEKNGGTLLIPGSHKILSHAGNRGPVGSLPPAINLEAPAGTIMLFDGRTLHGTGPNRSDDWRYVMTQANNKSWLRQQESWPLTVKREIIENASPKLLRRMGMSEAMVKVRLALEDGTFNPLAQLTPDEAKNIEPDTFTIDRPI
jgi:hypothetical protein